MGAVAKSILSVIGETPLVHLGRLYADEPFRVLAKLEGLNPGGSIKDRPALEILQAARVSGEIQDDSVIVESSSGNMGIGLAQLCRYHGLRFICVVDPKASSQNLRILRAYGAEIDLVEHPDPESGEFLQARLARVRELVATVDRAFWPNQYANPHNPDAHYATTMAEIDRALDGEIDVLLVATSTCGTLRGCAQYVAARGLKTRVFAVDARGSRIFSSGPGERRIPGLGAGFRPPFCRPDLVQQIEGFVEVSDLDCVVGCRRLLSREAIFAGGSSGGVISAVDLISEAIAPGSNCVVILPDRGERYLDTVYDDGWVAGIFGAVEHLWARSPSPPVPLVSGRV